MRVGVLALQGDVREHTRALLRAGADPVEVRTAAGLEIIDALVIPGGESTTIGRLAERYGLIDPLRRSISGGLPVLGTCAGMIFLAGSTTGAPQTQLGVLDAVVERNAFGRQVDSFETDLEVTGFDEPVHAVFIRAPLVAKLGAEVEVLAAIDGRPVMVRQHTIVATAFHPELTDDPRIHAMIVDMAEERR